MLYMRAPGRVGESIPIVSVATPFRRERASRCHVTTNVVFFPFDLFGSPGTAAGVQLLADELREVLADNRREKVETRARCYTDQVKLREFAFETLADYADWRAKGRQAVRQALKNDDFVFWITG